MKKLTQLGLLVIFLLGKWAFPAEAAADLIVTLISGPSSLKILNSSINLINVVSAYEMYNEILKFFLV